MNQQQEIDEAIRLARGIQAAPLWSWRYKKLRRQFLRLSHEVKVMAFDVVTGVSPQSKSTKRGQRSNDVLGEG